jgi:hypothetical protein
MHYNIGHALPDRLLCKLGGPESKLGWPERQCEAPPQGGVTSGPIVVTLRVSQGYPMVYRGLRMARLLVTALVLAGMALGTAAWASSGGDYETSTYLTVLFIHQVLFVFWLGPDIGIFMWSTKATNPELSPGQRVSAGRIMRVIDIIPKACMSLMLTMGGILTELMGIEHPWWQMVGIVLLGPVWLTLILLSFRNYGTDAGRQLAQYDIWLRWLVVISVVGSTTFSIVTGRLADTPWVTGKLLLFAAVVFFSIMMRSRLEPFMAGIERLDKEGPSEEIDAQLAGSVSRARLYTFATWIALAMAAGLGMAQPGGS